MDTISGKTAITVEGLPISTPTPPSSESNLTKQEQPDMTNTHIRDIRPPSFINSVNELRSLSTALSTFFHRYDELHNHLNFINSSIDSKLPNHHIYTDNPNQSNLIETSCAHSITAIPEAMVPERNPNGTASNCERSIENVRKTESPNSSKKPEENDTSMKPEEILEEIYMSKEPEEIDASKELEDIDVLKKPEEIDVSMNPEEIEASSKHEETDNSKKPEEIYVQKNPEIVHVSKKPEKIDVLKKPEKIDVLKKPEETDTVKEPVVSELESLCEKMCARDMKRYVAAHISDMNELREEIPRALKLAKDPAKLVLDSIGRFFSQGKRAFSNGSQLITVRLAAIIILECFVMISSDGIEIAKKDKDYAAEAAIDWRMRMINEGGLRNTDEVDARGLLLLISGFGIPNRVFKNGDIWDLIKASNVKGISSALRRSIVFIPKVPEVIDWMVKNNLEIEAADIAYTFGLEDKCHPQTILTTFLHSKVKDSQHGSSAQVIATKKQQLSDLKSIRKCLESHKVDPTKVLPDFKINEKIQHLEKEINELDLKSTQKRKAIETASSQNPKQHETKRTRLSSHENVPRQRKIVDHYGPSPYNRSTQPSSSNYFDRNHPNDYITTYSTSSFENGGGLASGSYGSNIYGGTVGHGWHENSTLVEKYLGQPYSRQFQAYDSQPSKGLIGLYGRPSELSTLKSFPGLPEYSPPGGFPERRGRPSDLYSFADTVVKNESYHGSHAAGSGTGHSPYLY